MSGDAYVLVSESEVGFILFHGGLRLGLLAIAELGKSGGGAEANRMKLSVRFL